MSKTKQKIDLHIHTPASSDYQGDRGPKGYLNLIRSYKQARVDTVAFTDHNTIRGYIEFQRIKKEALQNYELNARRDDTGEFLKILKEEMFCLNAVSVIPGIEISAYPGMHLIFLFNEEIDLKRVESFLENDLGFEDTITNGRTDIESKLTPVQILDLAKERFNEEFLCILPHVDSSKGAWNVLTGIARSEVFKHPVISAVQIIHPDTKKRIESTLENTDYQREKPFGIIQASDYHAAPSSQPASQHIVAQAEAKINFKWLKQHISHSNRYRLSSEFTEEAMREFLEGNYSKTFDFQNQLRPSEELKREITKALCACLNTHNSLLRFNLFNIIAEVSKNREEISNLINSLRKELDPSDEFEINVYDFSLSESRQRFIVKIQENNRIRLFENMPYVLDSKDIRPAKAWEIEKMVSEKSYYRYGKSKQRALVNASTNLLMISNSLPAIPLAARIDRYLSKKLLDLIEIKMIQPSYDPELEPLPGNSNGSPKGDFYFISSEMDLKGGRLASGDYFRVTVPTFLLSDFSLKYKNAKILPENSLLIYPDGGVNFAKESKPLQAPFPVYSVTLCKPQEYPLELLLGLCTYLKSSFVLWYLCTMYQTDDLFSVMLSGRLLPLPSDLDLLKRLAIITNNVILSELSILKNIEKFRDYEEKKDIYRREIVKHNSECASNMKLIDKEVLRYFCVNKSEIEEIYRVLNQLDLYDYDINKDIDKFIKDCTM